MESRNTKGTGVLLTLILLVAGSIGIAAERSPAEQRAIFLAAEEALDQGAQSRYQGLKSQLTDYPLLPYLIHSELRGRLHSLSSEEAESFLTGYADTPLVFSFRSQWLHELARRKQWWTYRAFYKPNTGVTLHCYQLQALIDTGKEQRAFAQVPDIWRSGNSLPDACDPVLDRWRAAGKLTQELAWERIELAMEGGNLSLASYLSRFLNEENRRWYQTWIKAHHQPQQQLVRLASVTADAPVDSGRIWQYAFRRLVRQDPDAAIALWQGGQRPAALTPQQRYQSERYLTLRLLMSEHPQAMRYLKGFVPEADDRGFIERRLRYAIAAGDWSTLLQWIDEAPESIRNQERWRYWYAYTLEQLARNDEALAIFRELAAERSYHGFLAADRIGVAYNLNNTPLEVDPAQLRTMGKSPALQRAGELVALERYSEAKREWHYATRNLSTEALQAAARIAQSWHWHDQAIFTLARTRYWEDLEFRFPLLHTEHIAKNASQHQLNEAWIYAVIRQESAFGPSARSHAGALGLMQLMPATAQSVARKLKRRQPRNSDLLTPQVNIGLGTAYLKQVKSQLDGNEVLATAAYNAGPHRVKSWLPQEQWSADRWIECIPYNETREYTERVMSYAVIYEQRLGLEPGRLSSRLLPILPERIITAGAKSGNRAL